MNDKIHLIEDADAISKNYEGFLGMSKDILISEKLEEVMKERVAKKSEKEIIRDKMKEIFNLNNETGEEINPYKKQEEAKRKEKEMMKNFVDPVK